MSCTLLHLNIKLKWKMFIVALIVISSLIMTFKVIQADAVIVHANVAWEMTDVVVQEKMTLSWKVEKDDLWSFNPQLFPEGHTADGIPVEALKDYACPGQPIGKLIGRIGDYGRIFPMGTSGSIKTLPSEDGEFLYLTMNDDLIGQYGKGFKDNEGEIIVKIAQSNQK